MGEFDGHLSGPTFGQKLGGTLLVGIVLAILGAGLNTWRIADANRTEILRLKRFAERGERCTFRDCQRIEDKINSAREASRKELNSHDHSPAHREAEIRLKALEAWREKRRTDARN